MSSIFKPGDVLGNVELLEYVDQGAQGEIWAVRDLHFRENLNLAMKLRYTPWDARNERSFVQNEERLAEEERLLGNCRSSYIIAPHFKVGGPITVGEREYAYFGVVMDLATELSLKRFCRSDTFKTFTTPEKLGLLMHLARGLAALQHFEIIHNDIKPANILVSRDADHFLPRYADFGYAFQKGRTIARGGTPGYMAPEVLQKIADPSFDSDVYSLGITFYEILLGHHPLDQLLSEADPERALLGYYPTHEYIDSSPLLTLQNKDLADLIRTMCSRAPERRPHISEILETLDGLTHDAKTQVTVRPDDLYPQLANRYRWSDAVHLAFGETEQILFVRGTRPELDALYLAERLVRARIFGYSIFRMIGATDFVLRVWRREADRANLEEVLHNYQLERGDYESFTPVLRAPHALRVAEGRLKSSSEVLPILQELASAPDDERFSRGRKAGAVVGEAKSFRERSAKGRRNAIRALCRVRCKRRPMTHRLAAVVLREIRAAITLPGVREIEVMADPGSGPSSQAEFIVVVELASFHIYAEVLQRVERTMSSLVDADIVSEFRSLFEMDAVSKYESYDGRLLYELYKHRPRRDA